MHTDPPEAIKTSHRQSIDVGDEPKDIKMIRIPYVTSTEFHQLTSTEFGRTCGGDVAKKRVEQLVAVRSSSFCADRFLSALSLHTVQNLIHSFQYSLPALFSFITLFCPIYSSYFHFICPHIHTVLKGKSECN